MVVQETVKQNVMQNNKKCKIMTFSLLFFKHNLQNQPRYYGGYRVGGCCSVLLAKGANLKMVLWHVNCFLFLNLTVRV